MAKRGSERLSDELAVELSPDAAEWFDGTPAVEPYSSHPGLFTERRAPDQLLDVTSATIWGGQMLPDTLPILGDGCGNVLSLRFGSDGAVSEVIHWNHEGGFWRPFGRGLSEAILCDIATARLGGELQKNVDQRLEEWAVAWVRRLGTPDLHWPVPYESDPWAALRNLTDSGLAEMVSARERCEASLVSELDRICRRVGGGAIARDLGVVWDEFHNWLFDTDRVPDEHRASLGELLETPVEELLNQDWNRAEHEARRACERRPDLGWPHAILGWMAQRQGNLVMACEHYLAALHTLGSSDDFVQPFGDEFGTRFVICRLRELQQKLACPTPQSEHLGVALRDYDPSDFPSRFRRFWLRKAEDAERRGEPALGYEYYYNAGWDEFVANDMEQVLDGLARTAEGAGWPALHQIAMLHRASLQNL